jgi:copper chaperone CopZ
MKTFSFKSMYVTFLLVFLFIPWNGNYSLYATETQDQQVVVHIDGLSCPFCAFGVEKKLKKLEGLKDIKIKMNEGQALLTFEAGVKIDVEAIKEAVKESGFTAREIVLPQS